MVMNEEERLAALRKGAVLNISDSDEVQTQTLDALPPNVRECYRASREHDLDHQRRCPDCLEDEAANVLMDAASHREDGNEVIASELESEAEQIRLRAATLRESQTIEAVTRSGASRSPGARCSFASSRRSGRSPDSSSKESLNKSHVLAPAVL
jgi:hypothetical protein